MPAASLNDRPFAVLCGLLSGQERRGRCLQLVTNGLLFVVLVLTAAHVGAAEQASRPNIILVMADDLGWSDVGCYGGEIPTPAIDSLARDGMLFTQFYNNSICGPTRASLLTGLYCQQVGHRGDHWNDPKDHSQCVLLPEMLQAAGYRTSMVGKWQGRQSPLDRGFDRFFGPMCQGKISYFHEVAQNPYYLDRKRYALPDDFYLTDALNDHASLFLQESLAEEQPFFLYVAHIAPHWPLHAVEEQIAPHRERYRQLGWDDARQARFQRQQKLGLAAPGVKLAPQTADIMPWGKAVAPDWQAERMAVYAAQVASVDAGLAQLLQAVEKAGKTQQTLVVFLSDNGAAPDGGLVPRREGFGFQVDGDNTKWRRDGVAIRPGSGPQLLPGPHDTFAGYGLAWANVSNTPLRGGKLTAYEGGVRTPLLVRWPDQVQAGSRTSQVGHVFDWMPTVLELAGVAYPTEFHGRHPLPLAGSSLVPVLHGKQRTGPTELCWSARGQVAIRAGDWKALRAKEGGTWSLFQLAEDPTETTDLAAQHPQQVQQLERQFQAWQERVGAK
ncbi:arylsulfatase [Lignipirellula cremea]|uniref:Arylsulfatase n=1 Tax=Lignipirellula cremea TaxID=2528010 RepID=A0A518E1R3_9BACT|nr:arylsulfatase [Lignipirellula cremea]QDU98011.1 Arylsulfatase precursor [Lignipirellula cremea]